MEQGTMKKQTILKIANYKQKLAELESQFWFEDLDKRFYKINYDRLTQAIKELENETY